MQQAVNQGGTADNLRSLVVGIGVFLFLGKLFPKVPENPKTLRDCKVGYYRKEEEKWETRN